MLKSKMLPLDVAVSDFKISKYYTLYFLSRRQAVAVFPIFVAFEAGLFNILYNIPSDR